MLSTLAPHLRTAQALRSQSKIITKSTPYRIIHRMSEGHLSRSPFFRSNPVHEPSLSTRLFRRTFASGYGPGPSQTHRTAKAALWTIIGLNTTVFGLWKYAEAKRDRKLLRQLQENATLSWSNIQAGRYHTLITSAFSHMSFGHFIFNMISLNALGGILTWTPGIGAVHIISITLGSALAGSFAYLYHERTRRPRDTRWGPNAQHVSHTTSALGASGVVLGIGAAGTCLMPFASMFILPIPVPIPLWLVTIGYAAFDIYGLDSGSRIGHSAHLGGSIYGALYYFANLRRYGGVWQMILRRVGRR